MPVSRPVLLFVSILVLSRGLAAQQTPQRDAQAVAILQQSLVAMGGTVPTDSVATGTITVVAGSTSETGTIRILSRGVDQSAEQIQTTAGNRAVIYSRGFANEVRGTTVKSLQLELVVTSQSPDFPLPLLAAALNNPDIALQYIGLETLAGVPVQHIRFWNSFGSQPTLKHLAGFSIRDVWLDAGTGLPRKLGYDRRAASGAEPRIALAVFFSDYRNVGGVVYPFRIQKSLNGTPWTTITIGSVAFNTGLTDADFPVQ